MKYYIIGYDKWQSLDNDEEPNDESSKGLYSNKINNEKGSIQKKCCRSSQDSCIVLKSFINNYKTLCCSNCKLSYNIYRVLHCVVFVVSITQSLYF